MEKRIEAKGNIIETLEGERFRILELVSESRMSVVYRAERLIEDGKKHNVLLKAFVISEKFEYSLDVYQEYVRHELEINQKLNAIGFTGALTISYVVRGKKDGIVYGVILNIQSGMTLQKYATTANFRYVTLRDRIDIIKKLAVILDEFHKGCEMAAAQISEKEIQFDDIVSMMAWLGKGKLKIENGEMIEDKEAGEGIYLSDFSDEELMELCRMFEDNSDVIIDYMMEKGKLKEMEKKERAAKRQQEREEQLKVYQIDVTNSM